MKIGKARPTYLCIKNENTNILWFIPMSTKVDKYKKIRSDKIKKYGSCDTILIRKFLGKDAVFLLQNMFPTIEKYVDHIHTVNGDDVKVISKISNEIESVFNKVMAMVDKGKKIIFTDVEKDMKIMLKELNDNN